MDTQLPVESSVSSTPFQRKVFPSRRLLFAFLSVGFLLIFFLVLFVRSTGIEVFRREEKLPSQFPVHPTGTDDAVSGTSVIATVGSERIFQKDLDRERAAYPPPSGQQTESSLTPLLMDKLTRDSQILQDAAQIGLISLDETVFNSYSKNYEKRIVLVSTAKDLLDTKNTEMSGVVLSLWFDNDWIGPLGYEQSKQLAYTTLSSIQQRVARGEITPEKAADLIRSDSSLAQIDKSYQDNASFSFKAKRGERITLDPDFDAVLWNLSDGSVSDVFLSGIIPEEGDTKADALYMFAVITQKRPGI